MKKQIKPDIAELVIEMRQQLVLLEKKIDTLINRPSARPFEERQHRGIKQDSSRGERTLYKAICADCNKECQVPFRPSQDRPVYCKECFSSRKGGSSFHTTRDNRPKEGEFTRPRPFDRYRSDENRKFPGKKKPAFRSAKSKKRGR